MNIRHCDRTPNIRNLSS